MSSQILEETLILYHSVMLGIYVAVIYDIIRIFRRIVHHNRFFLSLEDILYWIFCAWEVFYLLYEENSGVLRWFTILGIALGMFLYLISISGFVVGFISGISIKCLQKTGKIFGFVTRPVKKKLTSLGKMLKIVISKH